MRNAEPFGDVARVVDILPGAAGALAVGGGAVVVELQRDADDVVAFALHSAAVDEESTPPDIATTTRVSSGRRGRSRLFSVGAVGWVDRPPARVRTRFSNRN